jgi:hypothetical protein
MKSICALLIVAIVFAGTCFAQVTFSVKPGLNLTGAGFGYKINKVEPYIGLKSVGGGYKYEEDNTNTSEERKLHVYLPHLGMKYEVMDIESVKSFINLSVFKALIAGKSVSDGNEDEDFKDELKKIGAWGMEAGFASEYFLNEHFSLGGEFGLRYAFLKYKDDEQPDPFSQKLNLDMTYALMSLNFYF